MSRSLVPGIDWLSRYETMWLRADVLAGLTTAAVVIPKAMAYATIAGLPVQVGLYTALVPMVVYAVLGSSRPLSVSTTTTLAILSAAALGSAAPGDDAAALVTAAATLAVMTGAILLLARLLRLGFIANFISDPVLTGFKAGIGLVIVLDQAPKVLGVHYEKVGWLRDLGSLVQHLPETHAPTLVVGLATLAIVIVGVFGIWGVLRPGGARGLDQGGTVIIEKETGTKYVYDTNSRKLLPVANYASALLALNKKGAPISDETTFAGDLEFDSLTVMDFVAAIEDEFDIIISMNQQAEIENYGQLVDAVCELTED